MKRCPLIVLCGLFWLVPARGQTPEARKATIGYVQSLQSKNGGFRSADTAKSYPDLRATSAAVRALKYLGGTIRDKEACARFVADCFDKKSGGFSDIPGGEKTSVFDTAVGIMAVAELGMPAEPYHDAVVKYLAEHAKTFEDIRIAVAGLERIKRTSPKAKAWLEQVEKLWNADGTAGKEDGVARETASLAVTVLRLGGTIKDQAAALKAMKKGQRENGAYGKLGAPVSDLETTYRVMRGFMMLKDHPEDVEALRSFVTRCRNEDGGYAILPGEPSTVGATYFATIILHWMDRK
ncbi:MAG TPA: prenyltransferase/squalene oxidase repeat-containing protein [Gemmataceae bacterium]|nr:prenyltransferase/squalene oxidase repeat-containing protein [Gemmataceae bacterium]